ncbi:TrbC/VirB2 family protein [Sphingomonas sp. PB2P12]|uniref:TrbC/VirB2 family protein n=1 Tax=Sphingomonas sandaracina TaxID=3096157 RepID=UPI002FC901A6
MTVYPSNAGEGSSLVAAARWIEGALFGSTATAIAIIAVAGLGFLLLTGRVDLRRGATVVMGCFILFGAPVIAARLYALATFAGGTSMPESPGPPQNAIPAPAPTPAPAPMSVYDPYAGASVPVR